MQLLRELYLCIDSRYDDDRGLKYFLARRLLTGIKPFLLEVDWLPISNSVIENIIQVAKGNQGQLRVSPMLLNGLKQNQESITDLDTRLDEKFSVLFHRYKEIPSDKPAYVVNVLLQLPPLPRVNYRILINLIDQLLIYPSSQHRFYKLLRHSNLQKYSLSERMSLWAGVEPSEWNAFFYSFVEGLAPEEREKFLIFVCERALNLRDFQFFSSGDFPRDIYGFSFNLINLCESNGLSADQLKGIKERLNFEILEAKDRELLTALIKSKKMNKRKRRTFERSIKFNLFSKDSSDDALRRLQEFRSSFNLKEKSVFQDGNRNNYLLETERTAVITSEFLRFKLRTSLDGHYEKCLMQLKKFLPEADNQVD